MHKVVPVYKTGDINEVTNYRPISILSIFSKILEKLVHTRTLSFLNYHSVLTPTQNGFRPKYSTLQALLDITNSALDNIEKKLYPTLFVSSLIKSIHLLLGLPLFFLPVTAISIILFPTQSSSLFFTCSY